MTTHIDLTEPHEPAAGEPRTLTVQERAAIAVVHEDLGITVEELDELIEDEEQTQAAERAVRFEECLEAIGELFPGSIFSLVDARSPHLTAFKSDEEDTPSVLFVLDRHTSTVLMPDPAQADSDTPAWRRGAVIVRTAADVGRVLEQRGNG